MFDLKMEQGRVRKLTVQYPSSIETKVINGKKFPDRFRVSFRHEKYLEHKQPDKWRSRDFIFHTLLVRSHCFRQVLLDTGREKISRAYVKLKDMQIPIRLPDNSKRVSFFERFKSYY